MLHSEQRSDKQRADEAPFICIPALKPTPWLQEPPAEHGTSLHFPPWYRCYCTGLQNCFCETCLPRLQFCTKYLIFCILTIAPCLTSLARAAGAATHWRFTLEIGTGRAGEKQHHIVPCCGWRSKPAQYFTSKHWPAASCGPAPYHNSMCKHRIVTGTDTWTSCT